MSISVREHDPAKEKPAADNRHPERERRRKVMKEKRDYQAQVKKDGLPRAHVFQRIVVQLSGGDAWQCPNCTHQPWPWQDECPRCGTPKPEDA